MKNSPSSSCANIQSWLNRYRDFRALQSATRRDDFKKGFQRMARDLVPLQAVAEERASLRAADFNVFRVLRLAHKEVITHTPFLANLLNPRGTHAQGDLFLRLFLERLRAKQPSLPLPSAKARWLVSQELVTEFGNLDIRLRSHDARWQLVIENKIGAPDQFDQLARYWKQMMIHKAQYSVHQLVYLTPVERTPKASKEPLPPYTNLTYRGDICSVLESALKKIRSPRLQYSLEQYLEITQSC